MRKLTVIITAVVFAANFVVPALAATTSSTPATGTHKITKPGMTSTTSTKPGVTSTKAKVHKATKMHPSTKTTMAKKKMGKAYTMRHHKKMTRAAMRGKGPKTMHKKYMRKGVVAKKHYKRYGRSTGKTCPAMPGQTY